MESDGKDAAAPEESTSPSNDLHEDRRELLRRLGRFGAYTAPALLAILAAEKAPAATDA
jgi:hypothetical protein